jgi:uncharacterized protein (DUF2141 family)
LRTALLALAAISLAPVVIAPAAAQAAEPPHIRSSPDLGKAEGLCRPNESGPALIVVANGLKDRNGRLRVELYPANDDDFLQDDNLLVMAGKTFRRADVPVAATGPAQICIRLPGPGTYSLSLLHDRDSNHKFGLSSDGIGFPGNPRLGLSKPKAKSAIVVAGNGLTTVPIVLNYRRGLFSFGPIGAGKP